MKSNKLLSGINMVLSVLFAALILFLASCNNEDPLKPAPTLSLTSTETSNLAGAEVSTTVTVDAPEGGETLEILVNGVPDATLEDVALSGDASEDVEVSYTIPASAGVGSIINITFKAIDKKGQESGVALFKVTVSEVPAKTIVDVSGTYTTDQHWTADKIYRLNGFVRIGEDTKDVAGPGNAPSIKHTATLTIDAGTVIYGKIGTPGGALIIQRGSKIVAIGTANNPIVFTSEKGIGSRKSGDWAGLVICGKAANNILNSASTGQNGVEELEGAYGGFHGSTSPVSDDNSGTLQYVRVEYAGYPINPNQELNGVTFGSVGSGTTVDHVQVSYANDDSFEWFGGTVNCTNLIAYKGIDDDFDTDNGFSGRVQFGLGIRDANTADQSGSNGFESDNDAAGSQNTPFTNATFSNMTIIGAKATSGTTIDLQFQNGAQIRRASRQDIINSFITAYPNGIYIDASSGSPSTITNAANGDLVLKNNILAGVEGWGGNGFGTAATADEMTALGLAAAGSNHANAPRGRVIAGGIGAFSTGAFSLTNEQQISSTNPMPWFASLNTVKTKWNDATIGLSASIFEPLNGTPTLLPSVGSILLSGADFAGYTTGANIGAGFSNVAYRGAFGANDWTTGWVNWNPQIKDYSK